MTALVSIAIRRLDGDPQTADRVLRLLHAAFAVMEDRIDPPSSLHRMAASDVSRAAVDGVALGAFDGADLVGCVLLKREPDCLYVGKLAVEPGRQRGGIGRMLMTEAERVAGDFGLPALTLQARIELTENHAAFARMGFEKAAETAHPGYDRPTSITMVKRLR